MTDASTLTTALGGRWHGRYGAAPCPVCQPEGRKDQTALTIRTDAACLLLHCKKLGCDFLDILAAAGLRSGDYTPPDAATLAQRKAEQRAEAEKRAAQAKRTWQEAQPNDGTVAETYLRGRGIACPLPATLRFHPDCWHGPTAKRWPAMVAAVQGAGAAAVHRTYLRPDGSGKADIEPAKAMLGPCSGGAVRLSHTTGPLVVCEGIETGLSLMSGLLSGPHTVWAALSTSGIQGLRLPRRPDSLIIATDGDVAGRDSGNSLAHTATGLGWDVALLAAPDGNDWNDVLQQGEAA